MLGKPANRFDCLAKPFYAAVNAVISPVAKAASDYCKQAAIYNLDLKNDATWQDIRQEVGNRTFRNTPSNLM